jgi:hypothetical protein
MPDCVRFKLRSYIASCMLYKLSDLSHACVLSYNCHTVMHLQTCRASIKMIIRENLQPYDVVTLLKFNNKVTQVFSELTIADSSADMYEAIENETACSYQTAFYDAIKAALALVPTTAAGTTAGATATRKSASKAAAAAAAAPVSTATSTATANYSEYDYWVCALTDGADNSSVNTVTMLLPVMRSSSCNAVFITVGPLQNAKSIRQLAECAKHSGRVGLHIPATGDSAGIREAFGQVAAMLGNVHMESL